MKTNFLQGKKRSLSLLCTQGVVLVQSDWRRIIRLLSSLDFQKGNGPLVPTSVSVQKGAVGELSVRKLLL